MYFQNGGASCELAAEAIAKKKRAKTKIFFIADC
jgi:hypothetical protein